MTRCRSCHQCGTALRLVLDGEQWCTTCGEYRRYVTHGWTRVGASSADITPCPSGRRCDEEEDLADDARPLLRQTRQCAIRTTHPREW